MQRSVIDFLSHHLHSMRLYSSTSSDWAASLGFHCSLLYWFPSFVTTNTSFLCWLQCTILKIINSGYLLHRSYLDSFSQCLWCSCNLPGSIHPNVVPLHLYPIGNKYSFHFIAYSDMKRVVLLVNFEKVVVIIWTIDLWRFLAIPWSLTLRMRYHFIFLYIISLYIYV